MISKGQKTNLDPLVPLAHHRGPKDLEIESSHVHAKSTQGLSDGLFLPVVTLAHFTVSNTVTKREKENGEIQEHFIRNHK